MSQLSTSKRQGLQSRATLLIVVHRSDPQTFRRARDPRNGGSLALSEATGSIPVSGAMVSARLRRIG